MKNENSVFHFRRNMKFQVFWLMDYHPFRLTVPVPFCPFLWRLWYPDLLHEGCLRLGRPRSACHERLAWLVTIVSEVSLVSVTHNQVRNRHLVIKSKFLPGVFSSSLYKTRGKRERWVEIERTVWSLACLLVNTLTLFKTFVNTNQNLRELLSHDGWLPAKAGNGKWMYNLSGGWY